MTGSLRPVGIPFAAAAPGGARVRTRLRAPAEDEAVLRKAGAHLGSLAGKDLAARCAEGRLDARGRARSRAARKRALTAGSSSRWAGAITRTSEDQVRLAGQNLRAGRASLQARIRRIQARLAIPAGSKSGRTRGYATAAERHAKTTRLQVLTARLGRVERQLDSGAVSVVRGGKSLLRMRNNLAAAGLTENQWHSQWESARLFLTADGEAAKAWGNETIRWHPEQGWLEIKLPAPLAHLANRPHGRYRLSCPVAFSYRGDQVAAQAASGAVRYDISCDPARGRWYIDASWKAAPAPAPSLDELRVRPVVAVDVNHGHLAAAVIAPDGNILGVPATIPLSLAGLPSTTRDGRLRAAISALIAAAKARGARAIVIEDLNFAAARAEGRERAGNRPSRGRRAGVRGQEQLPGPPGGVAVAVGRPVHHHAVGGGGEAEVGPADSAVVLLVHDPPAGSGGAGGEQPARRARGGDGQLPGGGGGEGTRVTVRAGLAGQRPVRPVVVADVHPLDRVPGVPAAGAQEGQPGRRGHRDRRAWAGGGHGIGCAVTLRPPSRVTSTSWPSRAAATPARVAIRSSGSSRLGTVACATPVHTPPLSAGAAASPAYSRHPACTAR